jgi:hypothetical protein
MWCAFLSRQDAPSLKENQRFVKLNDQTSLRLLQGICSMAIACPAV